MTMLEGVDELIDQSLDVAPIGPPPRYRHTITALGLNAYPPALDCAALIRRILRRVERNWLISLGDGTGCARTDENWRWQKTAGLGGADVRREKVIEESIVREFDDSWANHIATGFLDGTSDGHCAIDLAHRRAEREFEFIELKAAKETPMGAAFEVLKYGLVYLFSRWHAAELGYDAANPLLTARRVTLCVLAPDAEYGGYDCRWLESAISDGLRGVGLNRGSGAGSSELEMDFRFECFRSDAGTPAEIIGSRAALYSS